MHSELDSLDQKLTQLVRLTQQLRAENHQLRQDLANAQSLTRQNRDKIERTTARLESLLSQIPEDAP
jgi:regulator of replication initiation timing